METRSTVANLLVSLRPDQWTKNLFVFAALIFAVKLFDPAALALATAAFLIFCALSGAVYLINDVVGPRRGPVAPVEAAAADRLGGAGARHRAGVAVVLFAVALGAAFALGFWFGVVAASYVALFILYTYALKHVVILDVMSIAIGFVLRAVAGGLVIGVPISDWLLVSIVLLALFLGLSKRRHELTMLADGATGHRRILEEYDPYLLDQMIAIVAAATLVVYIIYCASPETAERFGTRWLVLTTPFPIYGIFRYLYLVHRKHGGGSPSDMLLRDRPLLGCVALWGLAVILIIYRPYAS